MHAQGTIRRWDSAKGFGFIQGAHSANVFFHVRDFRGNTPPAEGMRVEYEEIQVGGKGPRAMDVRPQAAQARRPMPTERQAASSPRQPERPRPATTSRRTAAARDNRPAGASLAMLLMLGWPCWPGAPGRSACRHGCWAPRWC